MIQRCHTAGVGELVFNYLIFPNIPDHCYLTVADLLLQRKTCLSSVHEIISSMIFHTQLLLMVADGIIQEMNLQNMMLHHNIIHFLHSDT